MNSQAHPALESLPASRLICGLENAEFQGLAGDDGEDTATIEEIEAGLREVESGQGIPWDDVRRRFIQKYGL